MPAAIQVNYKPGSTSMISMAATSGLTVRSFAKDVMGVDINNLDIHVNGEPITDKILRCNCVCKR